MFAVLPLCCRVWHGFLQVTDADIRRRVLEAIGPRNPQHAALMQIFERKVLAEPLFPGFKSFSQLYPHGSTKHPALLLFLQ